MRIHIQNPADEPVFSFDQAQWDAAIARNPDIGAGHQVSFANDAAGFAAAAPEMEALITWVGMARKLFPHPAPKLKLISFTSAGMDRAAPFDWVPPGVSLLNNRGAHGDKAGEFALMAVLMLGNLMPRFATAQREQVWKPAHASVLKGRSVVVVGTGTLGGAAAEQLARLGMRVTGVSFSGRPHPACERSLPVSQLDSVLPETEFLVLAAPLTPLSRNMLSRERIAMLPASAGIVNIGRGPLIDEEALLDALDAGRIAGAVLDVFAEEPVPPGHRLWTTRNLIMTPHMSADDPATYNPTTLDIFFANLRALRDGKPMPNRIDTTRGY